MKVSNNLNMAFLPGVGWIENPTDKHYEAAIHKLHMLEKRNRAAAFERVLRRIKWSRALHKHRLRREMRETA